MIACAVFLLSVTASDLASGGISGNPRTAKGSIAGILLGTAAAAAQTTQQQLRGGRVIGVLERWLITGFALAGQPTAAALVVSAKSIVRFPELSAKRTDDSTASNAAEARQIDHMTEYFLLGSMSSWVVALLPAMLLLGQVSA